jgi:hypothetical protein
MVSDARKSDKGLGEKARRDFRFAMLAT